MIEIDHLTKYYGDFLAVDDLTVNIEEGHVYGFLGPNGAGKSTTMNIMTGCLSATSGHVRIDGYDIFEEPDKAKKLIGYLPEQPPLYVNESPAEYLHFVGEAKGLSGTELQEQMQTVIDMTGIGSVKNRRISSLSKGYRQRVGIAQALLGNPKVIILDEPTVGLDPIQIIEIRDLIRKLGEQHTVLFSSHILSEVQTICDEILIISKGRLAAFDTSENLEKKMTASNEIRLVTEGSAADTEEILNGLEGMEISDMQADSEQLLRVRIKTDTEDIYSISRQIFFAFAKREIPLLEMSMKKANLEEVFLELTEAENNQNDTEREAFDDNDADDGMDEVEAEKTAPDDIENTSLNEVAGEREDSESEVVES